MKKKPHFNKEQAEQLRFACQTTSAAFLRLQMAFLKFGKALEKNLPLFKSINNLHK